MLSRIPYFIGFAIGLVLLGIYVATFVHYLTYVPQGLSSRSWPTVVGRVQDSYSVSYSRGSILRVQYEFEVDGVRYSSSRFRFSPKNGASSSEVEGKDYAPGQSLTVYYDAQDPSQCVLQPGVSGGDWFVMTGMAAVLGLLVAIVWASVRQAHVKRSGATSTPAIN